MQKAPLSCVRVVPMKEPHHLQAMARHALRVDSISRERLRPGAEIGTALTWTSRQTDALDPEYDPTNPDHARDVWAAYKHHKARLNLGENKNGGVGLHVMTVVSASFFAETGDVYDPGNPRIKAHFEASIAFVEHMFGAGSVYMARMDLDELGTGVVDLFVAPHRIDGRGKKTSKKKICGSKVLVEIAQRFKVKKSYVALQTEYANWCQAHLDPGIHRGRPKSETGADHLPVDLYKEALHRELQREEREAASQVERILSSATEEAAAIVEEANEEAIQVRRTLEAEEDQSRESIAGEYILTQFDLSQRERVLQEREHALEQRELELDERQRKLRAMVDHYRAKLMEQAALLVEANTFRERAVAAYGTIQSWLNKIAAFALGHEQKEQIKRAAVAVELAMTRLTVEEDSRSYDSPTPTPFEPLEP